MTVTSPASGARAPRRRTMRRLLATGAALLLVAGWATPASADTVAPSPSPSASAQSDTRVLELTPAGNGVVRTGSALSVAVDLRSGATATTGDSRVVLAIGTETFGDRGGLTAWLDGESDPALADAAESVLPATVAGDESTVSLTIAPEDPALAGRAPGVYALRATATVDAQDITSRSVMIVPDDAGAAPVGIVVPITAGALEQGLLTSEDLARLTAPAGDLTAQLSAVAGTSAILAVDPAIPAAIRVLGRAAPASAVDWLERLEGLANSRFALQFGDADLATQLQAGLSQPLAPTSLQAYMDAADFAPAIGSTPAPTASPSATPGEPVYPDMAQLTDIGDTPRSAVYWPATGSAGTDVVAALGALGAPDASALTLIPSTGTSAGAGGGTVAAAGSADGSAVLVYDEPVSQRLSSAASADDPDARSADLVAATADLVLATGEAAGRPLLVTVDRATGRDGSDLRAAIAAATTTPGFAPASLDQLAAAPADGVEVQAVDADSARTADTTLLMTDEASIAGFATILDDPAQLTGPQRAEILQLLGVAWRSDASASELAVTSHRASTAETLDSVGIISTNVILVSYGSDGFRPYVRNDLGLPVTLSLVAQPDDASVVVADTTSVRAEPASNTRVNLPIEARIANATAVVSMQLYSPTGVPIGAVESATVEVHAQWESIGLVALVIVMVLFVVVGLIRTVRRRRVRRAQEAAEAGAGEKTDAAEADAPRERPATQHPEGTS